MSKTLLQMRTEIRDRCDQPGTANSGFVTDSELNTNINASIAELHDILINAWGADYYVNEYDFALVADQEAYDLPADFYKEKAVDVIYAPNVRVCLRPFNFNERNNYNNIGNVNTSFTTGLYRYRLVGTKLRFIPLPQELRNIKLWYHPKATTLVNDSDLFDGINGYEEYVVVDNCIKIMVKEEQDPTAFYQQKNDLKMRIMDAAENRQDAASLVVTDMYSENDFYSF